MTEHEKLLEGKTAFVTGGSMNLGAVTAKTLAQNGAKIAINYLDSEPEPTEVLASLQELGSPSNGIPGDLSHGSTVVSVVKKAIDLLGGRIDILVNNAGPFNADPFASLDESEWDRILNVNLKAVYLATQGVVPGMKDAGWGRIINMSAGSKYIRNHGIYGLAKAAISFLTEELALELGPEITVNAVAPGQIAESGPDISAIDPTFVDRAIAHSPGGRLVTRPEVANLILWLCSPAADMITGLTIPIDAGWRFNRF
ncbi:MAG: SDR family oxidoreductase [Anaerolineales bacterium]|nr:SDR family oxidoreductase [Anaerolineales bacterium]